MICSGSQKFLDGFSLTAVFKCCHNVSPLSVIVIITDIIIHGRGKFVKRFGYDYPEIFSFYELDVNEYFYAAGVGDICNPAEDLLDSVKW